MRSPIRVNWALGVAVGGIDAHLQRSQFHPRLHHVFLERLDFIQVRSPRRNRGERSGSSQAVGCKRPGHAAERRRQRERRRQQGEPAYARPGALGGRRACRHRRHRPRLAGAEGLGSSMSGAMRGASTLASFRVARSSRLGCLDARGVACRRRRSWPCRAWARRASGLGASDLGARPWRLGFGARLGRFELGRQIRRRQCHLRRSACVGLKDRHGRVPAGQGVPIRDRLVLAHKRSPQCAGGLETMAVTNWLLFGWWASHGPIARVRASPASTNVVIRLRDSDAGSAGPRQAPERCRPTPPCHARSGSAGRRCGSAPPRSCRSPGSTDPRP